MLLITNPIYLIDNEKRVYYIFKANSMLVLVFFEDDRSCNFPSGDKTFGMLKRIKSRKNQHQWQNVKVSITSFHSVKKVETDILYKCNTWTDLPFVKKRTHNRLLIWFWKRFLVRTLSAIGWHNFYENINLFLFSANEDL